MRKIFVKFVLTLTAAFAWHFAHATEPDLYLLTISNHKFEPMILEVPAGKKIKLVVKNLDMTPEEFESYDLNREKVVAGKSEITVNVGPLKPGTYKFFGEFHKDTAQGQLVAK